MKTRRPKTALTTAKLFCQILDERLAQDITLCRIPQLLNVADYFIVATANSLPHLEALQYNLHQRALGLGLNHHRPVEGKASSRWQLLDFGFVIVHLMDEESRERYRLDELWGKPKKISWTISSKKSRKR